ncbi:MAG: hypothetical protein D6788_07260 [Planctomycetota bacterium]|nr:MAG: hypothetical protein D6788_07260 [Planctomycetota bacterium]
MLRPFCAAAVVLMTGPTVSVAAGQEWTAAEKACARSIGVQLGRMEAFYGDMQFRQRSWYADAIVIGVVVRKWNELRGGYHTMVEVEVKEVLKGDLDRSSVIVALVSGPFYDTRTREIMTIWRSEEPRFSLDEKVLLFLTRKPGAQPDPPPPSGRYRVMGRGKYVVEDGEVFWGEFKSESFPLDWVRREIELAVRAQASGCKPGGEEN